MDYTNPDYTAIFAERAKRLTLLMDSPELLQAARIHYKTHPADFINDWGMTFDPRQLERGLLANIPFILWPRQREYIEWLYERWRSGERGIVEKSRDCGVTWLSVGFAVAAWCFHDGVAIGFGSRKEGLVDKLGDPDSIFEKIRHFVRHVPQIFLPPMYSEEKNATFMRLINPAGSSITGEAGDNIGRGGRKAQPIDAPILTPAGWRPIGELVVGDSVIGRDGLKTKVVGIADHGERPVYLVTFKDGVSTKCCGDHLWTVRTRAMRKAKRSTKNRRLPENITIPTKELIGRVTIARKDNQKEYEYEIPLCEAVELESDRPELDPYVVGVLLGDGSVAHLPKATPCFTSIDQQIIDEVDKHTPEHCVLRRINKSVTYNLCDKALINRRGCGRGIKSRIKQMVISAGIAGCKSENKFIPDGYKFSTKEDRLSLLQGLMDTDGWVTKRNGAGKVCFSSASKHLAMDVRFLVESLGGVAAYSVKQTKRLPAHVLVMALPNGVAPFRLDRKSERVKIREQYVASRKITSIKKAGSERVRCITVASADGLYLTNNCIVTHNSVVFVDEAAFVEHQEMVDKALSQTTNCQIDISTFNGSGNAFYEKTERFKGTPRHFVFDWRSDPRKDDAWYQRQKEEQTEETVAQEIDRDPLASNADSFIPAKWVKASIDAHIKLGFGSEGIKSAGFDPADTGDAKGLVIRHGSVIIEADQMTEGDITQALPWAFSTADQARCQVFAFDADGMGAPVIKTYLMTASASAFQIAEYRGSGVVKDKKKRYGGKDGIARTNGDTFVNYRAQTWAAVRRRFELTYHAVQKQQEGMLINIDPDELISISSNCANYNQLVSELPQPKRLWRNGKIGVENKKDMTRSPNLADALVVAMSVEKIHEDARTNVFDRYVPHRVGDAGAGY